jgi:hypothetical protein
MKSQTGTMTVLVPCPKCRAEKRCDKSTKRFRCKSCGFTEDMVGVLGTLWNTSERRQGEICRALDPEFYGDVDSLPAS